MSLWDGAIRGRLHTIAKHAVSQTCGVTGTPLPHFFMSFDAVQAVLPDIVQPRSPAVAPFPYVLMARLKDNVYVLCVDIPERYVPSVRRLLEVFLDCPYRIPLKWEPEGPVVAWCCSHILCGPHRGIGLLQKGVTWDLMAKGPEQVEWPKWLPKKALNARMVMFAYLPSLAHQSVWHATTLPKVLQNFRSIVDFMGVAAIEYPNASWKQILNLN